MYPGLVSCPFYAIPIYPFKFMKFFIYLCRQGSCSAVQCHAIQCAGVGVSSLPTFVGSVAAPDGRQ